MKNFILLIGSIVILSSGTAVAKEKDKDVFKEHGFDKAPLTLSNGRYNEFFSNEEVVQIGTVLLNTKTNKIVAFLDEDTTMSSYQAENSSRWLSPDPLAEKYYSISPYVYCLNNPLRLIDPDGRKIEFAANASQEFKDMFANTVKFMNEKGTSGFIANLQKSDKVYVLEETTGRVNSFQGNSAEKSVLKWNPNLAKESENGSKVSPATLLNHEADHANEFDKHPAEFIERQAQTSETHDNKEEERVITGSEQDTAKKHGDIQQDGVTRENHRFVKVIAVDDPTKNGSSN